MSSAVSVGDPGIFLKSVFTILYIMHLVPRRLWFFSKIAFLDFQCRFSRSVRGLCAWAPRPPHFCSGCGSHPGLGSPRVLLPLSVLLTPSLCRSGHTLGSCRRAWAAAPCLLPSPGTGCGGLSSGRGQGCWPRDGHVLPFTSTGEALRIIVLAPFPGVWLDPLLLPQEVTSGHGDGGSQRVHPPPTPPTRAHFQAPGPKRQVQAERLVSP